MSDNLRLNLDNFEDVGISKSTPYILTSPGSLKACEELFIEPTELLYHGLDEYENTLPDLPLSEIYRIYDENETERQEKLLKCKEMRNTIKNVDTTRRNEKLRSSALTLAGNEDASSSSYSTRPRRRITRESSSAQQLKSVSDNIQATREKKRIHYDSETESLLDENEDRGRESKSTKRSTFSKSVPDLRRSKSNLDFKKMSPLNSSSRICVFGALNDDNQILHDYMMRYGDLISSNELNRDDRKILELLVLKKGREMERDKLSQKVQGFIEKDRQKRIRETNSWNQRWHDRLIEKRRLENIENSNRFTALENQCRNNRLALLRYLEGRDARVQKYLEQIQFHRKKRILEKQQQEAIRQLEVGRTIDKLLDEDRHNRERMAQNLQARMHEAEVRKRRKEQDNYRHVQEMNRLEEIKRDLKHEQLELAAQRVIDELRIHLDEKEQRASRNYLTRLQSRSALISEGAGNRNKSQEKARALHAELLMGLEEWHKRVLDLQIAAQERATLNYAHEIARRRTRVASERAIREQRSLETLRRVHEKEEKQRELVMDVIEMKNSKSARVKEEKERTIYYSRLRAQLGAEMRHTLRESLDPETFDKKARRAETELWLLKKSPGRFSTKINTPKINFAYSQPNYMCFDQPFCTCKCKK